jgi:hypothetical protein
VTTEELLEFCNFCDIGTVVEKIPFATEADGIRWIKEGGAVVRFVRVDDGWMKVEIP